MRPRPDPVGPDQESVWDYPRPPRIESSTALVEIELAGRVVASTSNSWLVLETSHPPTYYLPGAAFAEGVLREVENATWCEWKGRASYFDLVTGDVVAGSAAWTYVRPGRGFESIAGWIGVMPGLVERCSVDGETVVPQPGGFYGGWITSRVAGPFKGGPGTNGW